MRLTATALAALAASALLCSCGAGHRNRRHRASSAAAPPAPAAPPGPAFGLTEDNADLLWNPQAREAPPAAAPFLAARRSLTELHPRYLRLLIDWAALQPTAASPPTFSANVSGCARQVSPCGAYPGVEGELAAIASQQRGARAEGRPGFEVVFDILGAPPWAALPAHGCEQAATAALARPLRGDALPAYKALIEALAALSAREGVTVAAWSPWNEPNDPRFLSPQRRSCARDGAAASPAVYAQLAGAMSEALKAAGGGRMLLGELGGYESGSPHRLSVAQFVAGLPAETLCLSDTWALHEYAAYGRGHPGGDPVAELEAALAARGGCASSARIWITEAGAGAPDPGRPRAGAPAEERAACMALAAQVAGWLQDPRVGAVFQYTFRDDPAFPVGLASADLARLEPVYGLWRLFSGEGSRATPQALSASCAG